MSETSDQFAFRERETIEAAVAGVMNQSHDELWRELDAESSALVRAGTDRANSMRAAQTDPGDAYLEGLTQGRLASLRIALAKSALANFDPDAELDGLFAAEVTTKDSEHELNFQVVLRNQVAVLAQITSPKDRAAFLELMVEQISDNSERKSHLKDILDFLSKQEFTQNPNTGESSNAA